MFVDEANQPDQIKELSRADLQAVVQASLQDRIQPQDPYKDDFGTTIA
jgi:hypothetical protein